MPKVVCEDGFFFLPTQAPFFSFQIGCTTNSAWRRRLGLLQESTHSKREREREMTSNGVPSTWGNPIRCLPHHYPIHTTTPLCFLLPQSTSRFLPNAHTQLTLSLHDTQQRETRSTKNNNNNPLLGRKKKKRAWQTWTKTSKRIVTGEKTRLTQKCVLCVLWRNVIGVIK